MKAILPKQHSLRARAARALLWAGVAVGGLVLLMFVAWLAVRQIATYAGRELDSVTSDGGGCALNTYTRRYSAAGVAGRIASLFGSSYYYRVYSRDGELLATSEWTIWKRESGGDMAAHWINGTAIYPGDGWEGWRLPQCN
ncbi:hypothetical protein KSS93_17920 [Pseudomonas xanthosomatis]|uniref:hypothetical protein n=1 Tax=Pseudomonas xanthosomatis TaxID=2842356 RepID=UPI001C3C618B|nr:hypothetical protein [Pseudomonas xanthosomatis]QXH44757.1 hypothetical protein KSS93_17920 [Pseudomonas xanthosomatis]